MWTGRHGQEVALQGEASDGARRLAGVLRADSYPAANIAPLAGQASSRENGAIVSHIPGNEKSMPRSSPRIRSTTILTVRRDGVVAMGGDGQVSLGDTVMKADARKVRPLNDGRVLTGFAGSAADAFALLERFEGKLKDHPGNMPRAATELAKDWRTDRALRRLEALIAVVDAKDTLLVSGTGDVIQPTDGILGIGSGGNYAIAAARALLKHTKMSAEEIVREALDVAGSICVYTNQNIVVETIES